MLQETLDVGPELFGMLMFATGIFFALTNSFLMPALLRHLPERTILIAGLILLAVARFVQTCAQTIISATMGTAIAAMGGGIT